MDAGISSAYIRMDEPRLSYMILQSRIAIRVRPMTIYLRFLLPLRKRPDIYEHHASQYNCEVDSIISTARVKAGSAHAKAASDCVVTDTDFSTVQHRPTFRSM